MWSALQREHTNGNCTEEPIVNIITKLSKLCSFRGIENEIYLLKLMLFFVTEEAVLTVSVKTECSTGNGYVSKQNWES